MGHKTHPRQRMKVMQNFHVRNHETKECVLIEYGDNVYLSYLKMFKSVQVFSVNMQFLGVLFNVKMDNTEYFQKPAMANDIKTA